MCLLPSGAGAGVPVVVSPPGSLKPDGHPGTDAAECGQTAHLIAGPLTKGRGKQPAYPLNSSSIVVGSAFMSRPNLLAGMEHLTSSLSPHPLASLAWQNRCNFHHWHIQTLRLEGTGIRRLSQIWERRPPSNFSHKTEIGSFARPQLKPKDQGFASESLAVSELGWLNRSTPPCSHQRVGYDRSKSGRVKGKFHEHGI